MGFILEDQILGYKMNGFHLPLKVCGQACGMIGLYLKQQQVVWSAEEPVRAGRKKTWSKTDDPSWGWVARQQARRRGDRHEQFWRSDPTVLHYCGLWSGLELVSKGVRALDDNSNS